MSLNGLRFTLDVDGLGPESFAVVNFSLAQHYSFPFVLEVDVASDVFRLTAERVLEKNATLTIWQGDTPQRYVTGVISTFGMKENTGWQMLYRFTIHPPLWRAGLRQNFRIFQQQDIQTITATLLNENGITAWTPLFWDDHPAREFCVQYGESDLAFLSRLWAEEGIFFFDKPSPDGASQTLTLCDDKAGLARAENPLPFNPNTREVTDECISVFRYEACISHSSVLSRDYTFKIPDWPGFYDHDARHLNGQRSQYKIFNYPGRYKDEQHGKDFTRYRMDGLRNDAEKASGSANTPKLWPGVCFTLTRHPQENMNRKWQVVRSLLVGEQPQALHGSQRRGTTLSNQFEVIPADRTWRSTPLPRPKVDGPQSAVVTGPPGEEIFCDEYGRIRVKFIWDRYHGTTEDSSCWIRVSQAWAGTGFGNLAIPRVGQEVIVDFLHGDPDQPIVMGRAYHEDNRSPGDLPGTKTQMTIRSKTYKGSGFNELKFDDATGKEQVYIHAQKNMDTEVLNNRTTDVKVDHSETIGNNQKVTVGLGQTVTVGKENAGGHDQKITVAHDRNITVRNNQTLKVKNDRMVSISHDDGLYVANDRKVTVEGDQHQKTTGNHVSLVEGIHSLEVKGDLVQKVSGALGIKVQGPLVLESSSQISLKVGASFVAIHAGGVDIMGPMINLNSGGSAGTPVQTLKPSVLKALTDDDSDSEFDEQFLLQDDQGEPIPFQKYKITTRSGVIYRGMTDQRGKTERITTSEAEEITFEYDLDDLE
ncbi:type VI secretion system tip protein VgrG [Buttiauxella sp. WJP83]|uniref:type VI secretion system Vgr family protein n=1 Tax=Buttiauxella sp. WJP83 TaxID=2986951 RepID=UPI0022DE8989|nr:type VI secretion system tip protein TssI/VgrG [Buttiauxella sp. WJP83]WBM70942.1 type VI secretion system tip protein VgrG [Buttiauxella sp. WJP83]